MARRTSAVPEREASTDDRDTAGDSTPRPTSRRMRAERQLVSTLDPVQRMEVTPHKKLAAAVMASCVEILKRPKPRSRQAVVVWRQTRAAEVEFIVNPKASAFWCEAAGMEWDVVHSKLKAMKLLEVAA